MVIFDAITAVNLLAGAVADGVCCLPHSLSDEEEKKRRGGEDFRGTASAVEYERQRLFDRECRERLEANDLLAGRVEEEEERARGSFAYGHGGGPVSSSGSGGGATKPLHHFDMSDREAVRLSSRASSAASSSKSSCRTTMTADERRRMLMEQKLRLTGGALASAAATRHPRVTGFSRDDESICSGMASLLDTSESSDEEEGEDEDGAFERIDLGDETYESSPRLSSRGRARKEYL